MKQDESRGVGVKLVWAVPVNDVYTIRWQKVMQLLEKKEAVEEEQQQPLTVFSNGRQNQYILWNTNVGKIF